MPRKRKLNLWQQTVSQVMTANPTLSFKDAIKKAKQTYKRLKKIQTGGAIRVNLTKKPKPTIGIVSFPTF